MFLIASPPVVSQASVKTGVLLAAPPMQRAAVIILAVACGVEHAAGWTEHRHNPQAAISAVRHGIIHLE